MPSKPTSPHVIPTEQVHVRSRMMLRTVLDQENATRSIDLIGTRRRPRMTHEALVAILDEASRIASEFLVTPSSTDTLSLLPTCRMSPGPSNDINDDAESGNSSGSTRQ